VEGGGDRERDGVPFGSLGASQRLPIRAKIVSPKEWVDHCPSLAGRERFATPDLTVETLDDLGGAV
jgi:hypothetical protein